MRGRLMVWCRECGAWSVIRDPTDSNPFVNVCPRCRRWMPTRKCTRCSHEWVPRDPSRLAGVCPRCKSPYWNREKMLRR